MQSATLFVGYSLSDDDFHAVMHEVSHALACMLSRRGIRGQIGQRRGG